MLQRSISCILLLIPNLRQSLGKWHCRWIEYLDDVDSRQHFSPLADKCQSVDGETRMNTCRFHLILMSCRVEVHCDMSIGAGRLPANPWFPAKYCLSANYQRLFLFFLQIKSSGARHEVSSYSTD